MTVHGHSYPVQPRRLVENSDDFEIVSFSIAKGK
jgi:hypothetical protein